MTRGLELGHGVESVALKPRGIPARSTLRHRAAGMLGVEQTHVDMGGEILCGL
jgi:hypothetical protein